VTDTISSGDVSLFISGNRPKTSSTLPVPGKVCGLTDVNVELAIDHTYVGDLDITLDSPDGTRVVLLDRPGVPPSTVGDSSNLVNGSPITYDDAATDDPELLGQGLGNSAPIPATTVFSAGPAPNKLTNLNGEDAKGDWVLTITDNFGADDGTLVSWSLELTGSACITGACCTTAGCVDVSEVECDGSYQGDETTCDEDADGNGVLDACDDLCLETSIPEESVPSVSLGINHFALEDDDYDFDTVVPKGKGPQHSYSIADTHGCSCEQIISQCSYGAGHTKFGCSISVMDAWIDGGCKEEEH